MIAGATGQLGPAVAERFASDGARLALLARSADKLEALVSSLPGGADRHLGLPADLSTRSGADEAAASVRSRLGPPQVLLHLVGGYAGGASVEMADETAWRALFELNLWTAFHAMRAFLPDIRSARDGRIVTISTTVTAAPGANTGSYAASKAALEALTVSVARDFAGTSATANIVVIREIGDTKPSSARPAEIAEAISWLVSSGAGSVNGQRIPLVGRA